MGVSKDEYTGFETAYDHFNDKLFCSTLPCCLITLNRKANTRGYYHPQNFKHRGKDTRVDELALNPDTFDGRSDIEILSTLVHEMVHVWQEHQGNPPRKCYHNKEWSAKMESIGLMPSDTGMPGGKTTGQKITHYIIPGGTFEMIANDLINGGFKLNWQSSMMIGTKKTKKKSKVKFTCPDCGQNAWGKPDLVIMCGVCEGNPIMTAEGEKDV